MKKFFNDLLRAWLGMAVILSVSLLVLAPFIAIAMALYWWCK